jgi:sugar lactone lactonase YvrE
VPAPRMSRRTLLATTAAAGVAATLPGRAWSGSGRWVGGGLPTTLALPEGFQPEGIAIGGPFAYVGSLTDGSIWRANLFTGRGSILSQGPGSQSVGLKLDQALSRLFVSGGAAGDARVISAFTGKVLATHQLAPAGTGFINDVVLTLGAAWFTNSFAPVLYRLRRGEVIELPLSGDFVQGEGFNANGIAPTPDGRALIVVQSNTGQLFRVHPRSGVATTVDLGGATLNGDGLLLRGRLLYVVHSAQVSVVRLDRSGGSGTVLTTVTDPRFETPTTVDIFDGRLYLPDARFTTEPTPTTPYFVYAIPIPR